MDFITADDIEDLCLGATLLGTGGGGDPYIAKLVAYEALERYGPVRVVNAADLPPDALVLTTAIIGAPTVILEKIPAGTEFVSCGPGPGVVHGQGARGDHGDRGRWHEHAAADRHRGRDGPADRQCRLDAPRVPADRDDRLHARRPARHTDVDRRREGQSVRLRDDDEPGRRDARPLRGHPARARQRDQLLPHDRREDRASTASRAPSATAPRSAACSAGSRPASKARGRSSSTGPGASRFFTGKVVDLNRRTTDGFAQVDDHHGVARR